MRSILSKVFSYVIFRYFIFFVFINITDKNVKMINCSDLKTAEDWFMFLWLFGFPVLFEFITIGLPMSYGLSKFSKSNKIYIYVLFLVLFMIEFLFANWIYGTPFAFTKIGISIVLFFIFFSRCIFYKKQ